MWLTIILKNWFRFFVVSQFTFDYILLSWIIENKDLFLTYFNISLNRVFKNQNKSSEPYLARVPLKKKSSNKIYFPSLISLDKRGNEYAWNVLRETWSWALSLSTPLVRNYFFGKYSPYRPTRRLCFAFIKSHASSVIPSRPSHAPFISGTRF